MDLFYTESQEIAKKISAPRKSHNPFRNLTDEEADLIAKSEALIDKCLRERRQDKFGNLEEFVPYEQAKPQLLHGLLAENLFRRQLKKEGLTYENLRQSERESRRQKASIQAYVDLVRDGVMDESVLKTLGDNLPEPSPVCNRGRPRADLETIFRIVQLACRLRVSDQEMFNILTDSTEFRQFAKIKDIRCIPSPKTIWVYREAWSQHQSLHAVFDTSLQFCLDFVPNLKEVTGKYVATDGSFVDAPKRHVSAAVHQAILDGADPVELFANPARRRQIDIHARHTKKNGISFFGYKDHAKVCVVTKLGLDIWTTPANVHDSQGLDKLITEADSGAVVFGDSAYNGAKQREYVESVGAVPMFMEKPSVIKKLQEDSIPAVQAMGHFLEKRNSVISSSRVRVEHVFGHIQTVFGGSYVRTKSLPRAQAHQWTNAACYNAERMRTILASCASQDVKT